MTLRTSSAQVEPAEDSRATLRDQKKYGGIILLRTTLRELAPCQAHDKLQLRRPHTIVSETGYRMYTVMKRAVIISAMINLSRELRDKTPCHGIRQGWENVAKSWRADKLAEWRLTEDDVKAPRST